MGVVDFLVGMYFEPETRRFKNYQAETIHYGWEEQPARGYLNYMEKQKIEDYLNRDNPNYEQQVYEPHPDTIPFGMPSAEEAPF